MKKTISLLIIVALCLSLVGCFSSSPIKETNKSDSSAQESKELVFGLNETAAFPNLKFTASELQESNGVDFFAPEAGKIFVGIKFTIENVSNEEQTVSSLLMFDGYVDDVKCDYSISAACAFSEGTLDGSLSPGKKLVGWYALEVPQNWSTIELSVQNNWLSNNPAKFVFSK